MGNIVLRKNRVTANTLIGKVGDLTYNSVDKTLFIHDGTSTGGFSLFRYSTTSAIVSGQIPFSNGTQGVLSTSTLLKWDNVNNYLGVGTSTPGYALDVNGIIKNNNDIIIAKGSSPYFGTSDNQSLIIGVNSTERFLIDTNGNIAIGNITAGNTLRYLDIKNIDSNAGSGAILRLVTSNVAGSSTSVVNLVKYKNGLFNITNTETDATACIAFTLGSSERLRIDSSGNVGINTVSPNEKLHVNGNIRLSGATSGYITLTPTAIAGTTTITLPATTGTVVTTGDTGTVTNTMLANSTISGISLGSNLATLTIGTGLSGTSYNGSTAVTITNSDKGSSQNIFKTINVEALAGSSIGTLTAANNTDSFKLKEGNNITLSVAGNTITITANVSGGGSSGVTTLNGLAGALSITSTGGNLTVSPSGSTIDLSINSTPASTLTGTIPSGVLGNSTVYIGSTAVALNRASANLALTGISSVQFPGSTSGTITLQATSIAGTNTITLPAVTGTLITTGDTGSVNSTMILDGTIVNGDISATAAIAYSKLSLSNSIVNGDISATAAIAVSKLAASTISGITLGNNLATLTIGTGLSGTSYNGSTAVTIANTGVLSINGNTGIITGIANASDIHYIGTTSVALNRASANLALTGISSVTFPGSTSGTIQLIATAVAGTGTIITMPATTGTLITSGDTATVTNTMLAGSIANNKLANSTISGISLGSNLATLTIGSFLTGTSYNGSAAVTIAVNATNLNTVSTIVARDSSGNFSAGTISATLFSGSGASLTSIPNGALVNSSITVNGTAISLGSSGTVTANTTNSLTFDNSGTGAVSGTTFNGSAARTISYNTIGAPSTTGTNASGSWGISVTGSSASCTGNSATATTLQTSRNFSITGPVTASSVSFNGSGDVQLASTINTTTLAVNLTTERVGIGTTSPSYKLDVTGDLRVTGTIYGSITGNAANITAYTINQSVGTGNSPSFAGLTVDTNTLYVDATNDRVGITTTSPVVKLHVVASNAGTPTTTGTTMTGVTTRLGSGSVGFDIGTYTNGAGFIQNRSISTHATNYDLILNPNGGNVGINTASPSYALHVSGAIYATGDVYAGSDIRMKENITELTNALDKIKNLQGYSYNKIGVNHRSIGLMAQDVEKIIPEVVSRNTEGMKGIDYGQMIAMLVEAIKELSTKLEAIDGTTI